MADMCHTIDGLTGTDTLVIISIRVGVVTVNVLHELSAAPCQRYKANSESLSLIFRTFTFLISETSDN